MKIKPLKLFLQIVPCLFGIFAGCQENFLDAVLQQLSLPVQMNSVQNNPNVNTYRLSQTTIQNALPINKHAASIINPEKQYPGTTNLHTERLFKTQVKTYRELTSNAYFIEMYQKPLYLVTGFPVYFH